MRPDDPGEALRHPEALVGADHSPSVRMIRYDPSSGSRLRDADHRVRRIPLMHRPADTWHNLPFEGYGRAS